MKYRCSNKKCRMFAQYGGRGIRVCPRWWNSFQAFFSDLGERPSPEHSLDRIDNNGGYTCGVCDDCRRRGATKNCRWATPETQVHNRRQNRRVCWGGRSLTVKQWSRVTGIALTTILGRLNRNWNVEDALTKPPGCRPVVLEHNGLGLTMSGWSKRTGIPVATINSRRKRGLPVALILRG